MRNDEFDFITPLSKEMDCLRFSLKLYPEPEATEIKDGKNKISCDFAVSRSLSPFDCRLLLLADPTINPIKLHRLKPVVGEDYME